MNINEQADYYTRASQAIRDAKTSMDVTLAASILLEPAFEALPEHCQQDLTTQYKRKVSGMVRA